MQKRRPFRASCDHARFATLTSTSGGSIETDVKAFTVIPRAWPSGPSNVTTTTPVANRPKQERSERSAAIVAPDILGYAGTASDSVSDTRSKNDRTRSLYGSRSVALSSAPAIRTGSPKK
jgi:hypothetical protein